jgi:hypothetical protein
VNGCDLSGNVIDTHIGPEKLARKLSVLEEEEVVAGKTKPKN